MFKIFAALRMIFALQRAHKSLAAVAYDAINRLIIPELERKAASARSPQDAEKYRALIAEYKQYADERNPKSNVFAKYAEEVVEATARQYNKSQRDAEEVAQDIASSFYESPSEMQTFGPSRFNAETGPIGLVKYFRRVVNNKAMYFFRQLAKRTPVDIGYGEEEEDPFGRLPAPEHVEEMDERMFERTLRDLKDFIVRKAGGISKKGNVIVEVFQRWMNAAVERGAGDADVETDVSRPMIRDYAAEGREISRSTVYAAWREVKKLMLQFFEQERGVVLPVSIKRSLRLSSEQVLIYEVFRRRLAAWVLGK